MQNKEAFSLVELIAVLFIVSIIIITLSLISMNNYTKYQERLALDSLISDIYHIQTDSLSSNETNFIKFYSHDGEYKVRTSSENIWKKLPNEGKVYLNASYVIFEYRAGNLVSKANTIDVKFEKSSYKIIIHIDSGYITIDEV